MLLIINILFHLFVFHFTPPTPPQLYTLSLHDALPISLELRGRHMHHLRQPGRFHPRVRQELVQRRIEEADRQDRKSTRLNSSHLVISYAVFCLKKKNNKNKYFIRFIEVHLSQSTYNTD